MDGVCPQRTSMSLEKGVSFPEYDVTPAADIPKTVC